MNFDSLPDDASPAPQPVAASTPQTQPQGASFDALKDDSETYGTPGQQAIAGAEAVGQGVLGPIAPYLETNYFGVNPEDIRNRAAANPITHGAGEITGLIGGSVTGTGEAAALEGLGKGAAKAAGLAAPTTYAARIGSSAVAQAAEMAALSSGDEATKYILKDPQQSSESAIANIGLGAVLGGASGAFITGVINPLWKATVGEGLGAKLKALVGRYGGIEGDVSSKAEDLAAQSGLEVPKELAPVINEAPGAMDLHSKLSQTDTTIAGRAYQKTLNNFNDQAAEKIVENLGTDMNAVSKIPKEDAYREGSSAAETLAKELDSQLKPIAAKYDEMTPKFESSEIQPIHRQNAADEIAQADMKNGWSKAENPASSKIAQKVTGDLYKQETALDLKKYITNLRNDNPYGTNGYHAATEISRILRSAQRSVIGDSILAQGDKIGPEAANKMWQDYTNTNSDYSKLMGQMDDLNEHLHVGSYSSPNEFIKNVRSLGTTAGERFMQRINGATKADVLNQLQSYPKTLQAVRDYHLNDLMRTAVSKAKPGENINVNNLVKNIREMSPQVQDLIASPEQRNKIEAIDKLLSGLKDPNHNFSNSGRTIDKLTNAVPSVFSLIAALTGHEGVGVLSYLGKLGFKEGSDGAKLQMLRMMGSKAPVSAEGFKAGVEFLDNSIAGHNKIVNAAKNVFKPGAQVVSLDAARVASSRIKLDNQLVSMQGDPSKFYATTNGNTGHYFPDHQAYLTQTSTRAAQYLQQLKPGATQNGVLDRKTEPSSADISRYNRALDIANNPNGVLQHVKNGTLQTTDLVDLKAMYPGVYSSMSRELSSEMTSAKSKGIQIPYKTRMSLSLFLGQPLDTSMQPQSIQATQMALQPQIGAQNAQQGQGKKMSGAAGNSMKKGVKSYQTPSQAAETDRVAGRTD